MSDRPFVLIIAGPNGSGKTTLTRHLRERGVDFGLYINPDEIAATLQGPYAARVAEAQQLADRQRANAVSARQSFSFETVMSHASKLDVLRKAKEAGFVVRMFFVATENPNLNVERVSQRVREGGHDVPADRIVARYARTLGLLQAAFELAEDAAVFDNSRPVTGVSGLGAPRLVVRKRGHLVTLRLPLPAWVARHLQFGSEAV